MTHAWTLTRSLTDEQAYEKASELCTCDAVLQEDQKAVRFDKKLHETTCPVPDEFRRLYNLRKVRLQHDSQ